MSVQGHVTQSRPCCAAHGGGRPPHSGRVSRPAATTKRSNGTGRRYEPVMVGPCSRCGMHTLHVAGAAGAAHTAATSAVATTTTRAVAIAGTTKYEKENRRTRKQTRKKKKKKSCQRPCQSMTPRTHVRYGLDSLAHTKRAS